MVFSLTRIRNGDVISLTFSAFTSEFFREETLIV